MDEKELVRLCKEGDEESFGALVNKYKTKVFHLAYSMTQNSDISDDLAQEVFIKAFFSLPKFKLKSSFGTWLYRIAVNHIRDFLRKEGRVKHISFERLPEMSLPQESEIKAREREMDNEKRKRIVMETIQNLPEKYRIILSLRDIQGTPYGEIAKILNISPGTVDSRLHRARKLLKEKMAPFLNQEGGYNEM